MSLMRFVQAAEAAAKSLDALTTRPARRASSDDLDAVLEKMVKGARLNKTLAALRDKKVIR